LSAASYGARPERAPDDGMPREEIMGKKLAISLFIVAIGASSSMLRAAPNQSLHFNAAAPAGAAAGSDDLLRPSRQTVCRPSDPAPSISFHRRIPRRL